MPTFYLSAPLNMSGTGTGSISGDTSYVTGPPAATGFTLAGPTTGTTGSPSSFTVTPNGVLQSTVVVTLAASNGGSVAPATLTFNAGTSATQAFTVTRSTNGTSSVSITNNGGLSNLGTPISYTSSPAAATSFALSGPTTGTTGQATTFTVTPNGAVASTTVVTPAASNGGAVSPSTLSFTSGTSTPQTFTVTRSADGTSSVSITNNGGLGNTGTPISFSTTAASTGIPTWAQNAIGSWTEIPNTSLLSVQPATMPAGTSSGTTNFSGKLNAWNSTAFDPVKLRIYCAANGGHNDYSGNEVDMLDVSINAPAWQEIRHYSEPVAFAVAHYPDGRPTSRHSYTGELWNPVSRRITTLGGAWYNPPGNPFYAVDHFDPASGFNDWESILGRLTTADIPSSISAGEPYVSYAINPKTGDIYAAGDNFVGKLTFSTNAWSTASAGFSPQPGYKALIGYDTKRDRFLVIGGQYGAHYYYDTVANTLTTITLTGAAAGSISAQSDTILSYVPSQDAYYVKPSFASGGTVYRIDAATFDCTSVSTTGGAGVPDNTVANGTFGRWHYSAKLGGFLYLPNYNANAWFWKLENPQSAALADWNARSTATGSYRVKTARRFAANSDVTTWIHPDGNALSIARDPTAGLIGDGALKITQLATQSGPNPGSWRVPLDASTTGSTPDGTLFVGVTNPVTYWLQFMFKLGTGFTRQSNGGGGNKLFILGEYRYSNPGNSGAHSNNEVVMNNQNWWGIFAAYRSDQGGNTSGITPVDGSGNIHLQSGIDRAPISAGDPMHRYCLYNSGNAGPGCYFIEENVWYVTNVCVRMQTIGTAAGTGNIFIQKMAKQGDTAWTTVHSVTNSDFSVGADPLCPVGPNGLWFTIYDTNRVSDTADKTCWYDQLIVALDEPPLPKW